MCRPPPFRRVFLSFQKALSERSKMSRSCGAGVGGVYLTSVFFFFPPLKLKDSKRPPGWLVVDVTEKNEVPFRHFCVYHWVPVLESRLSLCQGVWVQLDHQWDSEFIQLHVDTVTLLCTKWLSYVAPLCPIKRCWISTSLTRFFSA